MLKSVMVKKAGFDQTQKDKFCYGLYYELKSSQTLKGESIVVVAMGYGEGETGRPSQRAPSFSFAP